MEALSEPYGDSSLNTSKSNQMLPNDLETSFENMKKKCIEQTNLTTIKLLSYKEEMLKLKETGNKFTKELYAKNVNPEDPDLNVYEIFIIRRNKRSKARKRIQARLREVSDNLAKMNDEYDVSYPSNYEQDEYVNETVEAKAAEREFDTIFARDMNYRGEYESEEEGPTIPQSIAQVFL